MMKRIRILLLALSITGVVAAQSNPRWSDFPLDSYSINPASVDKYFANLKAGIQYRDQWVKFEGAPRTCSGFVTSYIDEVWLQPGLRFMADKIGYTHSIDINPTLAYSINSKDAPWVLNFGVGFHVHNFYYNTKEIVFEDEIMRNNLPDDVYEKKWSTNFDVGAEFAITFDRYPNSRETELLIGVVSQNLLSYWKDDLTPFANTNFGYAQLRQPVNSSQDFLLGASFMHSKNQYAPGKYSSNINQWEFNLKYRFYFDDSRTNGLSQFLSPGILFRTRRTWAPSTREFGIFLEYDWMRFVTIACTYEYPLSAVTRAANTWGTFELICIVRFGHPSEKPYSIKDKNKKWECKFPSGKTHDNGVY